MSHGAILSRLKTGFHRLRIPWGHNADHQPVGGKFTSREHALAAGCVLASYYPLFILSWLLDLCFCWVFLILRGHLMLVMRLQFFAIFSQHSFCSFFFLRYITFDISFSLLDPSAEALRCPPDVVAKIVTLLAPLGLSRDEIEAETHALWPALVAMKRRDLLYKCARELITPGESVQTQFDFSFHFNVFSRSLFIGSSSYFRELSIDELPGLTSNVRLATALAGCSVLDMPVNFIAPAFGFQKNFPFSDGEELKRRVRQSDGLVQLCL